MLLLALAGSVAAASADPLSARQTSYDYLEEGVWRSADPSQSLTFIGSWQRLQFYSDEAGGRRYVVWRESDNKPDAVISGGTCTTRDGGVVLGDDLWRLWRDETRLVCAEYLAPSPEGKERYWNLSSQLRPGDTASFGGTAVVMVLKGGKATDNLTVREGPSTAHPKVTLPPYYGQDLTYLPKGRDAYVVARTAEKAKVGDWEDYWFLIQVVEHYLQIGRSPNLKWVFARFVELDSE
jgi:hypothetical protein